MKRFAACVATLCVLGATVTAVGVAKKPKPASYASSVTMSLANFTVSGKVTSPKATCKKGRYVTIYMFRADGTTNAVAGDGTDKDGKYTTGTGFFNSGDKYKAVAPAKTVTSGGKQIKCKKATKTATLFDPAQ